MKHETIALDQKSSIAVIIVTHNSELVISRCLEDLHHQTLLPEQTIVVDSGSRQTDYLNPYRQTQGIEVILHPENIGFCASNNLGFHRVLPSCEFVLFLNPDVFLPKDFLRTALLEMQNKSHEKIGVMTGALLGYDLALDQPTGKYDSTGIYKTWYGRWFDRGQGERHPNSNYQVKSSPEAICGALMLCRRRALEEVSFSNGDVMDPRFYMYKEDIDLCLRLKDKGWGLFYDPQLQAYHCRGWNVNRKLVPKQLRELSAINEMRIYARHRSFCYLYSALKYAAVKFFNW